MSKNKQYFLLIEERRGRQVNFSAFDISFCAKYTSLGWYVEYTCPYCGLIVSINNYAPSTHSNTKARRDAMLSELGKVRMISCSCGKTFRSWVLDDSCK